MKIVWLSINTLYFSFSFSNSVPTNAIHGRSRDVGINFQMVRFVCAVREVMYNSVFKKDLFAVYGI